MTSPAELAGMLGSGPPVNPRPSASVLVVRGRPVWEVLLVRRPTGIDFAPGAHVFPGGSLHQEDSAFADPYRAAALRELFEEAGIFIGRGPRGPVTQADTERLRSLLAAGTPWREALQQAGVELGPGKLVPLTRWITPEGVRKRFDTHFFLARMPSRQTVMAGQGEIVDWLWIEPGKALTDPRVSLVHPTRRILESLAPEADAGLLMTRLRRRRRLPTVRPRLVSEADGWRIVDA